jgi:predicted Zn-dependent peptidase
VATWYQPSNATLSIAGPFAAAEVRRLVQAYFGPLPSLETPARPALPAQWPAERVRLELGVPGPRGSLTLLWRTPALDTPDDLALDHVARLLMEPGGPLRTQFAHAPRSTLNARESSGRRDSIFSITLGHGAEDVDDQVQRVQQVFRALAEEIELGAWARVHRGLADDFLFRLEGAAGRAGFLLMSRGPTLNPYDAIGPEDARRAIHDHLLQPPRAIIVTNPDAKYPPEGAVLSRTVVGAP